MSMYWVDVRKNKVCAFSVSNEYVLGKILVQAPSMEQAMRKARDMYDNFALNKIFKMLPLK